MTIPVPIFHFHNVNAHTLCEQPIMTDGLGILLMFGAVTKVLL